MHIGQLDAASALTVLNQLVAHPRHRFWADDLGYADISWRGVLGHRQVTDAYLAAKTMADWLEPHQHDRALAARSAHVDGGMSLNQTANSLGVALFSVSRWVNGRPSVKAAGHAH